jgi:caffeoyl-CoA O-methyltransferase
VAQVGDVVTLIEGDALAHVPSIADIAFCFLDAEKDIYAPCYQAIVPRLVPGGLLVADNATSHQDILRDFLENALRDPRVDALVVPVGRGELVCRKR